MSDEQPTEYSTPIPLRERESREQPNPYTRLEAADRVSTRVSVLAELLAGHPETPDRNALTAILETLSVDARTAVWGDLEHVRAVIDGAPATLWRTTVEMLMWPQHVVLEPPD